MNTSIVIPSPFQAFSSYPRPSRISPPRLSEVLYEVREGVQPAGRVTLRVRISFVNTETHRHHRCEVLEESWLPPRGVRKDQGQPTGRSPSTSGNSICRSTDNCPANPPSTCAPGRLPTSIPPRSPAGTWTWSGEGSGSFVDAEGRFKPCHVGTRPQSESSPNPMACPSLTSCSRIPLFLLVFHQHKPAFKN